MCSLWACDHNFKSLTWFFFPPEQIKILCYLNLVAWTKSFTTHYNHFKTALISSTGEIRSADTYYLERKCKLVDTVLLEALSAHLLSVQVPFLILVHLHVSYLAWSGFQRTLYISLAQKKLMDTNLLYAIFNFQDHILLAVDMLSHAREISELTR